MAVGGTKVVKRARVSYRFVEGQEEEEGGGGGGGDGAGRRGTKVLL